MNNLVPIKNTTDGRMAVLGRDLHNALEIRTKYSMWIERLIKDFDFIEQKDFFPFLGKSLNSNDGRPSEDHFLTLEMAKEICMITRNGRGKQVRKYFIEVEKAWNTPERVLAHALKVADHVIQELESKPRLETSTNEELVEELAKRLA